MNIRNNELKALRTLITKDMRKAIANKTGKAERTVEAVLNCQRQNDDIEKLVIKQVETTLAELLLMLDNVKGRNIDEISIEGYFKAKEDTLWTYGRTYLRYIDIYLQLCHLNLKEADEVFTKIKTQYADITAYPYYVIDIAVRLIGITPELAFNIYTLK